MMNEVSFGFDDTLLQSALAHGIVLGIPGISVAICKNNGKVWTGTAGYSDIQQKNPVKPNDRFCIGSITKTFVARVILQLAEEEKLDLHQTAADYLGLDILADIPNATKATLRQLINHQSGIPNWEFTPDWIRDGRGSRMNLGKVWGKSEPLKYIRGIEAEHEPGKRYAYANTNYTLLGLIIEAVTGQTAESEIRSRILTALNLKDTFFESFEEIPNGYVHHYHYATPVFAETAGIHPVFPEIRPYMVETTAANLSTEWCAGGMVSSASDLLSWAQAIKNGVLLGPDMQQEVFRYYPPEETVEAEESYMQGIYKINNFYEQKAVFGHGGGTLGFTCQMVWFDQPDLIIAMLTNVGCIHSGLKPSPVGMFFNQILLPAAMEAVQK